jgi:ADP-ribose pyrophosphatase YjhB (NUDIX family)
MKHYMVVIMLEPKWLKWAKQLQSISQAGLTYSKDVYDLERFEMIKKLSIEIVSQYTDIEESVIKNVFVNESGYATPKVDIRAVIFKEDKILMVREKTDGKWALPGGWADIGLTPSEVVVKEVEEESGFDVRAIKMIGVFDKKCHPHPPSLHHTYKLFILCEITGGNPKTGIETSDIDFFAENNLPPLSMDRNTESQIKVAFRHLHNPNEPIYFD